eukprot:CAMPEP_0185725334 /NCGR_PEP_ID=MMETSP1171-20130828/1619_1 /TAXON_ID=374046 /ORGANISM="Helicotheca tamensis, Strain CCMP826" /LENGTH=540 /DNA_ID=CAMNT_0028393439 /DNA_START=149 /DNA_END=1771 /DNA_ORIENTATION=-
MDIPSPSLRTRQLVTSYGFDCDCSASCTSEVLNYFAGPYKVGDRIKWLIESQAYGEQEACTTVCGSEFPDLCGTQCNPHACKTNISTPLPTAIPTQSPTQSMCGCKSCTQSILDTIAYDTSGGFTCRSRINWVMTERSLTEYDACVQVSGEFPNVCGQGCNPLQCTSNQTPTDKPTLKPSKSPTMSPSGNPTNSPTTVPTKYPTKSPTKAPTPSPMTNPEPFPCGCESCTQSVLGTIAYDAGGGYSCSARMDWLMTTQEGGYLPEYDACVRISSEFPDVCGPSCDPNRCNPVVVPQPDPTKLVWSDEFDTEGLPDPALWDYDIGGWGWGNNELQYYTDRPENAYISNGVLNIRAVKENYQNRDYTSARLVTKNLGDWTYGRVLVRARLLHCTGRGTWPAIWMLPTDWVYGGWPQSGEIDIMEHVGYDVGRVHGTVHTEAFNHGIGTQVGSSITIDVNDWHVYEVIWSIDKILFVVDGEKYHEFRRIDSASYREWPFDQRFHLLLNVAVGGNWGGAYGIDSTAFESAGQTMEIDWVRVYSS